MATAPVISYRAAVRNGAYRLIPTLDWNQVLTRRTGAASPKSPLFLLIAAFLTIWVLFGAAKPTGISTFLVLGLTGSVFLAGVVGLGGLAGWRDLRPSGRLLVAFALLMPLLQLVPLPPGLWHALPGRALPDAVLASVGAADRWRPMTLSVFPTFWSLLVFTWLAALLLAALRLSSDEFRRLFVLVFALGILNIAIGVVQVASGGRALHLHDSLHTGFLLGVFANKNHAGLFIAITVLAGYAARYARQGWRSGDLALAMGVAVLLGGAMLATFSRAGLVFGILAMLFVGWLCVNGRPGRIAGYVLAGAVAVLVAGGAVLTTTAVAGRSLSRFEGVGEDLRWSIWSWSWPLVGRYFPVGAGIGSFDPVFRTSEQLAWVKPTYVNNAHNDYLEQLIEVGIAAPLLWALIAVALAGPVRAAWTVRHRQSGRLGLAGAGIVALFALHSVVDYPLRRPALAALCIVAMAAVLRIDRSRKAIA